MSTLQELWCSVPILKSYICHKEQWFFISTIKRESSEEGLPTRNYMETMAWKYDWATVTRGNIMAHVCGGQQAWDQHSEICRQLYFSGEYNENTTGIA